VTNFLEGQTAGALANHPDVTSLYRQTGALLRTLHQLQMPGYGALTAHGVVDPVFTHAGFTRRQIDFHLQQFVAMGADGALAAELRAIFMSQFGAVVPHSTGAVFAHDDLHPNNVLAVEDPDGRLVVSGLIDFGSARAADPVFDLAKCLFCSEDDAPGSTPHILRGYGPIDHPEPQKAIRYYTLLHRITMWWWLRMLGFIPEPGTASPLIDAVRTTSSM
jgi:aminoglycoside phosphotransferase (APT) family kinase protein